MSTPESAEQKPTKLAEARARMDELEGEILELTEKELLEEHEEERYQELVAEYEAVKPEWEKLNARAKRVQEIQERAKSEFRGVPERTTRALDELATRDVTNMGTKEARDGALRILDDKESSYSLTSRQQEAMERFVRNDDAIARRIVATETDAYRSAFQKLITRPNSPLTQEESTAVLRFEDYRFQTEGATTQGGYGVPVFIDPSIILVDQENDNPFLNLATVKTITTNQWKGVSAAGVVWSFDDELDEVSDDSIELDQPSIDVFTARGFVPYSIEVGEDYPGFASELGRLLGAGYDELLLDKFTSGNGTSAPQGIITALDANTNVEVVSTTDGAFAVEDVYKVWEALPSKYQRRATWMMSVTIMDKIRRFATANNYHAFTVDLTADGIPQLLGRPVAINSYFPGFTGTTGAENRLVVGDFANYVVVRRTGMSVEVVPHLFGTTNGLPIGARGLFAYARIGGGTSNDLGFRLLQNQ